MFILEKIVMHCSAMKEQGIFTLLAQTLWFVCLGAKLFQL